MRIDRYRLNVDVVPVDFFADPDGEWRFDELVEAAGFNPASPGVCVGALIESFAGHPEGSAVIADMAGTHSAGGYLAVVECPATESPAAARRNLNALPASASVSNITSLNAAEVLHARTACEDKSAASAPQAA